MIAQKNTWMPLTSNQETFFNGVSKKNYIEHCSPETFRGSRSQIIHKKNNTVSVKEVDGIQNIKIYISPPVSAKTIVTAVATAGVFAWLSASGIETYTPPVNTYQYDDVPSKNVMQFTQYFSKATKELTWLSEFYSTAVDANTAKDIYPLISGIAKLFEDKEYTTVDSILLEAQLEIMSPTAMTTLVRTTYPARKKLANWDAKVIDIKNKLDFLGIDTRKVLRGLI